MLAKRLSGVALGSIALSFKGHWPSASAYPRGTDSVCYDDVDWHMTAGPDGFDDWAAGAAPLVDNLRATADDWNVYLDTSGNPMVVAEEDTVSATFDVFWVDTLPSTGWARCGERDIRFRRSSMDDLVMDQARFNRLVRHEFGHLFNLEHTGQFDDYIGNPPMMDPTTAGGGNTIRSDDIAQLAQRHEAGPASANAGFENGLAFWKQEGAATATVVTSPVDTGTKALAYSGSSVNHHVATQFRAADIHSTTAAGTNSTVSYRAVARVRRDASTTGSLLMTLRYRTVNYGFGDDGFTYPFLLDDWDLQAGQTAGGGWMTHQTWKGVPSSTTYSNALGSTLNLSCYGYCFVPFNYDFRIEISSLGQSGGWFYVDNARIDTYD